LVSSARYERTASRRLRLFWLSSLYTYFILLNNSIVPEVRTYKEVYTQVIQSARIHASDTKITAYRETDLARSLWSDYKSACLLSIGHQTELLFAFNSCTSIIYADTHNTHQQQGVCSRTARQMKKRRERTCSYACRVVC